MADTLGIFTEGARKDSARGEVRREFVRGGGRAFDFHQTRAFGEDGQGAAFVFRLRREPIEAATDALVEGDAELFGAVRADKPIGVPVVADHASRPEGFVDNELPGFLKDARLGWSSHRDFAVVNQRERLLER